MTISGTNVTINVKNLDRSIRFYESIGFVLKDRWGEHYAMLTAEGITLGLHPTTDANLTDNSGNVSLGFTTKDFDATQRELTNLSIDSTTRNEEGGKFIHFKDPDGTSLYFIEPKW